MRMFFSLFLFLICFSLNAIECPNFEGQWTCNDQSSETYNLTITQILKSDTATCLLAHDKFICLGTVNGNVHILDLNGNEIIRLHPHKKQINDLSLDNTGDYIASCSTDGN